MNQVQALSMMELHALQAKYESVITFEGVLLKYGIALEIKSREEANLVEELREDLEEKEKRITELEDELQKDSDANKAEIKRLELQIVSLGRLLPPVNLDDY